MRTSGVSRPLSYDAPTTEIYTLSLHDALPIWGAAGARARRARAREYRRGPPARSLSGAGAESSPPDRPGDALSPGSGHRDVAAPRPAKRSGPVGRRSP